MNADRIARMRTLQAAREAHERPADDATRNNGPRRDWGRVAPDDAWELAELENEYAATFGEVDE